MSYPVPTFGLEAVVQYSPFQVSTRVSGENVEPLLSSPTATQLLEETQLTPSRLLPLVPELGLGAVDHEDPSQTSIKV